MRTFYKNSTGIVPCAEWEPGCWIHIECPVADDKEFLEKFDFPISFLNDLEDIDERPRIEFEDGWYFILLRVPYRNGNPKLPFSTAPLGLIFKEDIFISICHVKTELIPDFINYSVRKNINYKDYFDLVLRLILNSSVWFLKYLKQINLHIKTAESELEKSVRNEDLQRLLQIEKCLVYFTTSLKGNDVLINRLKNIKNQRDSYDEELLEDVEIETKQAQETTNVYSDILSGMMDAYASVISNNLNIIMKRLTSISVILMIPTLIASLYGMNVPNGLEDFPMGFWLVFLISLVFSVIGMLFLRSKRWF
ncbi:MAG TPA: magnesium transporter CorA family protein [Bacteroidia bacterium]|nr:magnesium transporter CorA family protein [Bacteroidales bacterium]HRU69434.1 magnesium transporter CorA family protein [Bacteroidia bacterium]